MKKLYSKKKKKFLNYVNTFFKNKVVIYIHKCKMATNRLKIANRPHYVLKISIFGPYLAQNTFYGKINTKISGYFLKSECFF